MIVGSFACQSDPTPYGAQMSATSVVKSLVCPRVDGTGCANENRGGESVISWLLALTEIRELYRVGNPAMKPKAIREPRAEAPNTSTTR